MADLLLDRARSRVGDTLRGKWCLDELIGVGGSAAVYAATHRNGSRAALKMMHTELSADPLLRQRFLHEGYVANSVGHDGAVKIIDDDVAPRGRSQADASGQPAIAGRHVRGLAAAWSVRKRHAGQGGEDVAAGERAQPSFTRPDCLASSDGGDPAPGVSPAVRHRYGDGQKALEDGLSLSVALAVASVR
jgi:hypothetical protein